MAFSFNGFRFLRFDPIALASEKRTKLRLTGQFPIAGDDDSAYQRRMDPLVVGLLSSLGFVVLLVFGFFVIYRHHLRQLRHAHLQAERERTSRVATTGRRSLPFQVPPRWLAIRSSNSGLIRDTLVPSAPAVPWSDALARCQERAWFISPPIDGWTLVIGGRVPDAAQDVDALYRFLTALSRELGEVHFYSADRVLNYHAWARLDDGRVTRAYAWAADTVWNQGRPTLEERLLGLQCHAYGEASPPFRYGEVPAEIHNTERVILLARSWSLDLVAASEILVHHETVENEDDDEARGNDR